MCSLADRCALSSQSAVIYFFLLYAYDTTTARADGYDITMYEFSVSRLCPLSHSSAVD